MISGGQQIVHGLGVNKLHEREPSGLSGERVGFDVDVLDLAVLGEVLAYFLFADRPA